MIVYEHIEYTSLLFSDFVTIDNFFEEPVHYEAHVPIDDDSHACIDNHDTD